MTQSRRTRESTWFGGESTSRLVVSVARQFIPIAGVPEGCVTFSHEEGEPYKSSYILPSTVYTITSPASPSPRRMAFSGGAGSCCQRVAIPGRSIVKNPHPQTVTSQTRLKTIKKFEVLFFMIYSRTFRVALKASCGRLLRSNHSTASASSAGDISPLTTSAM